MRSRALSLLPFVAIACSPEPRDLLTPAPPDPPVQKTRFDLRAALGSDDLQIVGTAVDPFDGTRYVLDAKLGLYQIDQDGKGTLLVSVVQLAERAPIEQSLTDIVAIGNGKFALTARNDGFLLDLATGELKQHFCYEPGWIGDQFAPIEVYQLTGAVTVDPAAGRIYAQPQTIQLGNDDNKLLSQVGVWNLDTGGELEWYTLEDVNFAAGGMVVEKDRVLLMAQGNQVHRYTLDEGKLELALSLAAYNVTEVVGMALDADARELLVVDGPTDQLIVVPLD